MGKTKGEKGDRILDLHPDLQKYLDRSRKTGLLGTFGNAFYQNLPFVVQVLNRSQVAFIYAEQTL